MNNQRSSGDQLIRFLLLSFAAVLLYQHFFGSANKPNPAEKRAVPALALAFAGIDRASGAPSTPAAATEEIKKLNADIEKNESDEYSDWARLRKGLLEQYVLEDAGGAKKTYQELIDRQGKTAIDAQALYQRGDLLWRETTDGPDDHTASPDALAMFEQMKQRGRSSSEFLANKIFVARGLSPEAALTAIPPRFEETAVGQLKGDISGSDPQGILYRVNNYYAHNDPYYFYRVFDTVVRWFGNHPEYSYGLAILFFALVTRVLLQPLTKKQYESMKGMQVVAPEMKKIQEKYKGQTDPQAQQQMYKEIRAVYQKHGVSPMMGCALALVQMPLFFLVIYPLIQHFEARMELVGASFLWIDGLAHPDIPLLIVYGISMFFSFRLSSTPPTDDQQRMMQMMMSFVFPVVFPFFLLTYPSAFTMYWMTFNVVSTFFQWRMMKAADPDKSIIKTLLGRTPAVGVDPATTSEAVPPRPAAEKKKKVRTLSVAPTEIAADGEQKSNGKSRLNGTSHHARSDAEDNGNTAGGGDEESDSDVVEVGAAAKAEPSRGGRSTSRRSRRRRRH